MPDTKSEPAKDTVYIDLDDEITSVIDKVKAGKNEIVALVLPKRAAVLQSVVNMKLLKRMAQKSKKKLVLITSDAGVLALAGTVGLHVAKNLQSKPAIPPLPSLDELTEEISSSELAGAKPESTDIPSTPEPEIGEDEETIEVDNRPDPSAETDKSTGVGSEKPAKTDKKLKVPNFNKFRKRLVLIGLALVLLAGLWAWAFIIAPSATVIIKTEGKDIASNIDFTADAAVKELNVAEKIVPATMQELKKVETEKVAATGQKDVGTKASGTLTLKNCSQSVNTVTIPAGTGASSAEFTFITKEDVTLPASSFNGLQQCTTLTKDVGVTAQQGGDKYNLSARSYSVVGYPSVNATGSAMTGGTSQIIKTVSGADLDSAKQKLEAKSNNAVEELKKTITDNNLLALVDSVSSKPPVYTTTPNVGDEASELSVTSMVAFTMLGVKQVDLSKLIEEQIKTQVDLSQQPIVNDGLDKAQYRVLDKKSETQARLNAQVTSKTGAQIDEAAVKDEIRGKRRGDIIKIVQNRPGVQDVEVRYKPFWVWTTPKSAKKITIVVEQVAPNDNP